jgi:SsrA-binding protein
MTASMAAKKTAKDAHRPVSVSNRRAHFEYEITDTFEAGLVLTGTEVKSLRLAKVNLQDAFCVIQNGELWVRNMHVAPYEQGNRYNVEATRPRKLLLHNWQIVRLTSRIQEKGLTIVPTRLYFSRGRAKIEIGVGRGRKLYDKRDHIADRDRNREAQRELAER